MKVGKLIETLQKFDPELEVLASDPDRCNICWGLVTCELITVEQKKEFACSEFDSHDFPIGHQFVKLD